MPGKEYNMNFVLNALLGSGFGSTFSTAQRTMSETQGKIRELMQQQADISSYQKQQAAVEKTAAKLDLLQQQYDNIQREMSETEQYSSALDNAGLRTKQQIEDTTQKLEQQTQKLDAMEQELREAGIDTEHLAEEDQKLKQEVDKLGDELKDAGDKADGFGQTGAEAFSVVGDALISAGIWEGLKKIAEEYKECIDLAGEFESTMSAVEALSGASADEMENLGGLAKELGATTKYTAVEAAEAMTYMGMAGWDATQMIDGMDSVLQLAAASGEDLAITSDIVTDNLTAFGLTAKDTAHFSDVLAAAATNSNTSVSIMGETFKKAGPVAGALGYSIDDVAVSVGLMANAGVKGSRAGTALSNTFTGLLGGVTLTGQALGECEFSALKADGTMMDFRETVEALREKFSQMTEAEKTLNAQNIAGKQGYAGLLAIINATDADYQKLTNSIENCAGSAKRMAEIRMDNYAGQVTLLNSATDALKTTLGEAFQDELTKIVKLTTEIVSGVQSFLDKHPGVTRGIIATTATFGAFLAIYKTYQTYQKISAALEPVLIALKKKETEETLKANAAHLANPYILVAAGIAAVTAGLIALISAQEDEYEEIRALTAESKNQYDELHKLNAEYDEACATYGETSYQVQELQWRIDELSAEYEANKKTVEQFNEELRQSSQAIVSSSDEYRQNIEAIDKEKDGALELTARLVELAGATQLTTSEQAEFDAILDSLAQKFPDIADKLHDFKYGLVGIEDIDAFIEQEAAARKYQETLSKLPELKENVTTATKNFNKASDAQLLAYQRLQAAQKAYDERWNNYNSTEESGLGKILNGAAALMSQEHKELKQAQDEFDQATAQFEHAADGEEKTVQDAWDLANKEWKDAISVIGEYSDEMYGADEATKTVNKSIEDTNAKVSELIEAYEEAYNAAYSSVSGQYEIWDEAAEVSEVSASTITQNLENQAQYWANYNANLQNLQARTGEIEGLSDVIATFADGSEESVNAIAGMASASDEDLKAMVASWKSVQDEQQEVSNSIADLVTDFSNKMDELGANLAEDVENMNLSSEASTAAAATLDAYLSVVEAKGAAITAAYQRIADQAKAAMNITLSTPTVPGHAAGTDSAEHGYAIVGENGPELVFFNGGEQIANARETAAIMREYDMITAISPVATEALQAVSPLYAEPRSASTAISVPVTITVNGNASSETVTALRETGDEFAERVLSVIEEAGIDMSRGAYV